MGEGQQKDVRYREKMSVNENGSSGAYGKGRGGCGYGSGHRSIDRVYHFDSPSIQTALLLLDTYITGAGPSLTNAVHMLPATLASSRCTSVIDSAVGCRSANWILPVPHGSSITLLLGRCCVCCSCC
ncbi:hypothetical protein PENTCL1PPCAC_13006, partial [Pristionchus entomophagus]